MRRSTCLVAKAFPASAFGRPSMVATLPIAFSVCSNFPTMLISHRGICDNNIPRVGNKRQTRAQKGWGQVAYDKTKHSISPFEKTIDEVCADIDTKLTPEQQTYVDMLKKKMSGGALSQKVRSPYRDIATVDNLVGEGNFFPKMAENPQELIDFALSHLPPRAGPRRSRAKKRALLKYEAIRKFDKIKGAQMKASCLKIQAKGKAHRIKAKAYHAEALVINAAREKWQQDGLARLAILNASATAAAAAASR